MHKKNLLVSVILLFSPLLMAQNAVVKPELAATAADTGSVARASFASAIQNREPVDQLESADTLTDTLFFFTELKDMQGQTAIHRWSLNGKQMAEVKFNVGGPRWRVWSSKRMQASWLGNWTVDVVNGSGTVVESRSLSYGAAVQALVE